MKLDIDVKSTKYVNLPAILSANLWIDGFCDWTDSIRLTSLANEVSDPTLITFRRKLEFKFRDPFSKLSPSLASIGFDSPVMCETSIRELPSKTIQSAGTLSPARTFISSLGFNVLTLISRVSSFSLKIRVFSGCKSNNSLIEDPVWYLARSSKKRPSSIKPNRITGSLKKQGNPLVGNIREMRLVR